MFGSESRPGSGSAPRPLRVMKNHRACPCPSNGQAHKSAPREGETQDGLQTDREGLFESTSASQTKHSPLSSCVPSCPLSSPSHNANTAAALFPRRTISNQTGGRRGGERMTCKVWIFMGKSTTQYREKLTAWFTLCEQVKFIYIVPLWSRCHKVFYNKSKQPADTKFRQTT